MGLMITPQLQAILDAALNTDGHLMIRARAGTGKTTAIKVVAKALIERNPLLFWQSATIVLALAVIVLLAMLHGMPR